MARNNEPFRPPVAARAADASAAAESGHGRVPLVYVVVLNYNGQRVLLPCLESLFRDLPPGGRVLLVDNASADDSVAAARAAFPDMEVIANPRNLYFAAGNNVGIRHALEAGADYVFILNNDTTVEPGCLERLVRFMEEHPEAGGCQPLLCFMHSPGYVASSGCLVTMSGRAWDRDCGVPAADLGEDPEPALGITGGAALFRSEALRESGGFSREFGMYFEDVDLSLRLREAGWELFCVPRARVLHEVSATTDAFIPSAKVFLCERNSYRVVLRNFPAKRIVAAYVLGLPCALAGAGSSIIRGRQGHGWRVVWAAVIGCGLLLAAIPRRCLELLAGRRRTYPFWEMIDDTRVYPPACVRPHARSR